MSRRLYPNGFYEFVCEHVSGCSTKDLTALVNEHFGTDFSVSAVHAYKSNHRLRSGLRPGFPKGKCSALFPQEIIDYIFANHIGVGPTEMTNKLNVKYNTRYTASQLRSYYHNHHLSSGLSGRFQSGHVPVNKGKTWAEYMPPESQARSRLTTYQKGHVPANGGTPVGTLRVRHGHKSRNEKPYVWEKVAQPNVWRKKHRVEWEKYHGPVPKGCMVIFANGDTLDWHIDNLMLETKAQHGVKNRWGLRGYDKESQTAYNLIADIKMAVRHRGEAQHNDNKELRQ